VYLVEQRRKRFADEKLNDPIGCVEYAVAVIFAVLVSEFEPTSLANEVRAEQAFVNVAQLADFERAIVNGFVGAELALARAGACGRLSENQLPENIGERCIADAPGFELRMEIGVEQPAVVAGDAERFVLALVGWLVFFAILALI